MRVMIFASKACSSSMVGAATSWKTAGISDAIAKAGQFSNSELSFKVSRTWSRLARMVEIQNTLSSVTEAPQIEPGLVEALTGAYASLLKRQRTASAAFVRWSAAHTRAHEFAWLTEGNETILFTGREIRITATSPIYDAVNKMMTTIELNPYERELLYGYPYILGNIQNTPIRAPLLTIPITIAAQGGTLVIRPNEELVRFNSLPFRSDFDSAAHELALSRLIESTPILPLTQSALKEFCDSLMREMKITINGRLDGSLCSPPAQPRTEISLAVVDNAACFVAPKTSYFLVSDLERIGEQEGNRVEQTAVGWLLGKRGNQPTSNMFWDSRKVYYPFSSNLSQRRVAQLARNSENHIIVVQGPPGTGKSLTIANLVCDLVAVGKRVLVTSQKDKALEVVDELLRSLDLTQLPMTLLRQDRDSKQELRQRLDSIQKTKAAEETQQEQVRQVNAHSKLVDEAISTEKKLVDSLLAEHMVEQAQNGFQRTQGFFRRLGGQWGLWEVRMRARRRSAKTSEFLGEQSSQRRAELLQSAIRVLQSAAEHRTGDATRAERNQLREFARLLGRNQTAYKNFSVFDRMKREPDRCHMLLKILPCWIMTPDDVARLFPCEPGLFDVVIIDEASQCDLPSMTPILYRAKQAIITGDSRQMQAQRFAFTANQVAAQAWREYGLDKFDPDRWLDPSKIDLLQLASVRLDEEILLDEHYRSLPAIITFSNDRWYGSRLRIMRDVDDRRFGDPDTSAVRLHAVRDGAVAPGSQENFQEAEALVATLKSHLKHPGYADASFGVLCLFDEQVRLVNEMVAEQIPEEDRTNHDLVVVNPDGFQGDERDVIYYSLSYDAKGMEKSQISARQSEREHIQGMLNVAFTRAREEMHIFHTAPIQEFAMATGGGVIRDWLEYCSAVNSGSSPTGVKSEPRAESEFEAQVMQSLQAKGIKTISQYPSCGYFIDIVAEFEEQRIALECDGEIWHLDEHGELKLEDRYRQEVLERAGWEVLRIPYRGWLKNSDSQIQRVLEALSKEEEDGVVADDGSNSTPATLRLSTYEAAVINALRSGETQRDAVLRAARSHLGLARLGSLTRRALEDAIKVLTARKLLIIEDGELFASEHARTGSITTYRQEPISPSFRSTPVRYRRRRRYSRYRRR